MNLEKVFFAHDMVLNEYWIDDVLEQLTENVYVTFDLDALDPFLAKNEIKSKIPKIYAFFDVKTSKFDYLKIKLTTEYLS